jgi:chemotaxis protein CheX
MSAPVTRISHDELVSLVREATENVFETMLGQSIVAGDAYLDNVASPAGNGVVSFIGLAGAWMGTGSISCSAPCACGLASKLMLTEYAAVDDDVLDAIAEVTNMILGNVKTSLEERFGPMGLSIPTVIYGRNFSSRTVGKQEWTVVPFDCGGERLEVQLCLAEQREPVKSRVALAAAATSVAGAASTVQV